MVRIRGIKVQKESLFFLVVVAASPFFGWRSEKACNSLAVESGEVVLRNRRRERERERKRVDVASVRLWVRLLLFDVKSRKVDSEVDVLILVILPVK